MPVEHTFRPSRAAITDVYEDVEEVLDATARRFARRYNQDYEEAQQEARCFFLTEYLAGKLSGFHTPTRVRFLVWRRLQSRVRLDAQRSAKLRRHPITDAHGVDDRPTFCLDNLLRIVSEDAATVLTLLFSDPQLDEEVRNHPQPGPRSIRLILARRLREMGWTTDRVEDSFHEIGEGIRC